MLYIYYGGAVGSRAVLDCEPRQVRKEAAVVIDAGAAMWLMSTTTNFFINNAIIRDNLSV